MLDEKLINDTLKMFECCSEVGRCDECPINEYSGVDCATAAPQLTLKVIKDLLSEVERLTNICNAYGLKYGTITVGAEDA